jgi:hypothetical protein
MKTGVAPPPCRYMNRSLPHGISRDGDVEAAGSV